LATPAAWSSRASSTQRSISTAATASITPIDRSRISSTRASLPPRSQSSSPIATTVAGRLPIAKPRTTRGSTVPCRQCCQVPASLVTVE
jgi:hypothetical protein